MTKQTITIFFIFSVIWNPNTVHASNKIELTDQGIEKLLSAYEVYADIPPILRSNTLINRLAAYREKYILEQLSFIRKYGENNVQLSKKGLKKLEEERLGTHVSRYKQLLELDPNGDGVLTANELDNIASKTFSLLDKNHDSIIDINEKKSVMNANTLLDNYSRVVNISSIELRKKCAFPQVKNGTKLIRLEVDKGKALSPVTIGGQKQTTRSAAINIKTRTPIYLVITSREPTIWQFTGNTDLVEHIIVSNLTKNNSTSGVTGLHRSQVTLTSIGCIGKNYTSILYSSLTKLRAVLKYLLGKFPYIIEKKSAAGIIDIYDNKISYDPERSDKTMPFSPKFLYMKGNPKIPKYGIVDIFPDEVIADSDVEEYKILPDMVGIVQMVNEALIKPLDPYYKKFLILKEIDYIPTIIPRSSTHLKFFVPKGMKPPEDIGNSCVIMEETGEKISSHSSFCQ